MKITSINTKHTKSSHEIAFNLDIKPSKFQKNKITAKGFYGTLNISLKKKLIILKSDSEFINEQTIINLKRKIADVVADEKNQIDSHIRMVTNISDSINIPLE